jgi:hypothetical protein
MKIPIQITDHRLFSFLVLMCVLWSGCAKYKSQHVVKKEKILYMFEEHKDNVDLVVRAFDQDGFKDYLSVYQPLHIHIKNKTAYPQELQAKNISLPVESLKKLKKQEPQFFSINFIPCMLASAFGIIFWWEIVLPTTLVLGLCAAQQSIRQHERAVRYLKNNTLFPEDTLVVPPFSSVDTLIFVKRAQYTPRFAIALNAPATNITTTFNVFVTARTVNVYHVN